jgi:transketolase
MSSGVAYGELGPTHHSIEDVAWMRALGNMTVLVPADPAETAQAIRAAAAHKGPVFLKISRMGVPAVHDAEYRFALGRASLLRPGRDVTIIANGVMVTRALGAATLLADRGVDARVLNMASVRPLDREAVIAAAQDTGAIVTVEEHTTHGGLGGAVAETVVATTPVPMRLLGFPGTFAPIGSPQWILDHLELDAAGIAKAALEVARRRKAA